MSTNSVTSSKKAQKDKFAHIYNVFEDNILLHQVSIRALGSYATKYDQNISQQLLKIIQSSVIDEKNKKVKLSDKDTQKIVNLLIKGKPFQAELFRKNTLVSIVSSLDHVFIKIFKHYYTSNPQKLSLDNQKLSFSELKSLNDAKEAANYLIDREVDLLLIQNGIKRRFGMLSEEIGIDLTYINSFLEELMEIVKIRNLIVHNEGKIDKEYAKKHSAEKLEIGNKINLSEEDLVNALSLIHFIGAYILQELQFKFSNQSTLANHFILNDVLHSLVSSGQHKYAKCIYTYAQDKNFDLINKQMIIINYCVSQKIKGESVNHIQKILDKEDWSAASLEFLMAIAILKGDDKKFYSTFEKLLKLGSLSRKAIDEWYIFTFYKKKKKFIDLVKKYDASLQTAPGIEL